MTTTDTIQQFDFQVDLLKAILWQYDTATHLQGLLAAKAGWYEANQSAFWLGWLAGVFDLRTADEFGLSVWAIILGLPLFVNSGPTPGPVFGFDEQTGYNFDNGIFGSQDGSSYDLPLEIKRLALRLRYFQITSSGTVPEINRMLKYLFADYGRAVLIDYHNMTQRYVFDFYVPYQMAYLFNNYDILPRPAGVKSDWVMSLGGTWGFASNDENFDNGYFGSTGAV